MSRLARRSFREDWVTTDEASKIPTTFLMPTLSPRKPSETSKLGSAFTSFRLQMNWIDTSSHEKLLRRLISRGASLMLGADWLKIAGLVEVDSQWILRQSRSVRGIRPLGCRSGDWAAL
jgi:hypothetical protein